MPPGGSTAQQNYDEESPNKIGNSLAADKAKRIGAINTGAAPANENNSAAANDNYQPYSDEQGPENDNNISAANDNISEPYPEGRPTNDNNVPQEEEEEEQNGENEQEQTQEQNMEVEQQAQLDAQQQADVSVSMANNKQRRLQQIQKQIDAAEKQLSKLDKDLKDFKDSKLNDLLKIFQPGTVQLVDQLIEQLKKQADKLTDEAKIGYYTGLITTASSLINSLRALKLFTSVLDAAFIWRFSCLRLVITTAATIILPIIIIVLSPIFIPFFALIFIIGVIPLLKGVFTKVINELITKLKKQRTVWREQLAIIKKKVALKKQIKALKSEKKQIEKQK